MLPTPTLKAQAINAIDAKTQEKRKKKKEKKPT
jgi:hypothetical protein